MVTPRSRNTHIRVQIIRRRSFKQRSKRAKYRKRNSKSTRIAQSLITPNSLKQNTRFGRSNFNITNKENCKK